MTKIAPESGITVSDTGVGIAPWVLPHIFEMFMQADDPTGQPRDGLGIGYTTAFGPYRADLLTSARRYVAMGKGAVFRLYFPNFVSEVLHHRPRDTAHVDVRT
jgi:signal transduction histidine kinase